MKIHSYTYIQIWFDTDLTHIACIFYILFFCWIMNKIRIVFNIILQAKKYPALLQRPKDF